MTEVNEDNAKPSPEEAVHWLNVVQAGSPESARLLEAARETLRKGLATRFPAHSWRLRADEWEGTDPLASFDHTSYRLSACCIGDYSGVCFLEDLGPFGPGVVGRLREQSAKIGRYPFDMKILALYGVGQACNA